MALAYVPITLTNNESTATGSSFQQLLLNIDMRAYEPFLNNDLSNVYFSSDSAGSTVINSWLESGNSSTSAATTWWVVTSVAANSTTTIYMQVDLTGTSHRNNTTTGEAPQLSSTYAEYDNGASVFTNYWNFAGTGLPTRWTGQPTYYTVNNGLSTTNVPSGSAVTSPSGLNPQTSILDAYAYSSGYEASSNFAQFVDFYAGASWGASYIYTISPSASSYQLFDYSGSAWGTGSSLGAGSTSTYQVFSIWATTTASYASIGYATPVSTTSDFGAFTSGTFASTPLLGVTFYYQWLRTRTYPPSGVMPSVGLGQPTNFPYINTSTNPVEVMDF